MQFSSVGKWLASGLEMEMEIDSSSTMTNGSSVMKQAENVVRLIAVHDSLPDAPQPVGCAIGPFHVEAGGLYQLTLHGSVWCTVGAVNPKVQVVLASVDESWQELVPCSMGVDTTWIQHNFAVPQFVTQITVHCCFSPSSLYQARSTGIEIDAHASELRLSRPCSLTTTNASSATWSPICNQVTYISHSSVLDPYRMPNNGPLQQVLDAIYVICESGSLQQVQGVCDSLERTLGIVPYRIFPSWDTEQRDVHRHIDHDSRSCLRCFEPHAEFTTKTCSHVCLDRVFEDAHISGMTNILLWSDKWWPRSELRHTLMECVEMLQQPFAALIVDGETATVGSAASTTATNNDNMTQTSDIIHSLRSEAHGSSSLRSVPFLRPSFSGVVCSSTVMSFDDWRSRLKAIPRHVKFDKPWICKYIEHPVHCVRTSTPFAPVIDNGVSHTSPGNSVTSPHSTSPTIDLRSEMTTTSAVPNNNNNMNFTIVMCNSEDRTNPPTETVTVRPDVTLLVFMNRADKIRTHVRRCIQNALAQSLQNWHMIIVTEVGPHVSLCQRAVLDQMRDFPSQLPVGKIQLVTVPNLCTWSSVSQLLRPLIHSEHVIWWHMYGTSHRDRLVYQSDQLRSHSCVIGCTASLRRTDRCETSQPSITTLGWTLRTFKLWCTSFARSQTLCPNPIHPHSSSGIHTALINAIEAWWQYIRKNSQSQLTMAHPLTAVHQSPFILEYVDTEEAILSLS